MIQTHAIVAAVALVLGFCSAWKIQSWHYAAQASQQAENAREQAVQWSRQANAAAASHEAEKAAIAANVRVITREVAHVVEKPVYRNVCIDADGLRVITDAIGDRAATGQPEPAMPAPGATE